ncbi:spore cortex biosynthesis protein YabQ [Terribacillus aidingensis]|uniref:Spore cortex biosynthesis protein YabQ n=1 Tax=Terribacillus aidingensis TaxID=586416 RepID=A0A285P9U2_9BACI|nr:spore cortex biosynthesis protein YabQ [Terribacillus aidingensis]SNZ18198.1 spore cortex biosynthesis protein YabQ [Terribacillus aidingensis]
MTLTVQFLTIVSMIAGGIYLGAAMDTFRRFERHWKKQIIMRYVMECGFWLLQALLLFFLLFQVNQGEMRFYILLALICGFAGYRALFQTSYRRVLEWLIRVIYRIIFIVKRILYVLVLTPLRWLLQGLLVLAGGLLTLVWKFIWLLFIILLYPIRMIGRLIWKLTPKKYRKIYSISAGIYSRMKNIAAKVFDSLRRSRR